MACILDPKTSRQLALRAPDAKSRKRAKTVPAAGISRCTIEGFAD